MYLECGVRRISLSAWNNKNILQLKDGVNVSSDQKLEQGVFEVKDQDRSNRQLDIQDQT